MSTVVNLRHNEEKTLYRCDYTDLPVLMEEALERAGFVSTRGQAGHRRYCFTGQHRSKFDRIVCEHRGVVVAEEERPFCEGGGPSVVSDADDDDETTDDTFPSETVDDEVKSACRKIVAAGQTAFICGASGTGKTTLLMDLAYTLLAAGKSVLVVSETPFSLAAMQACGIGPPPNTPLIVPQLMSAALGIWSVSSEQTPPSERALAKSISQYHRTIYNNWKNTDVILIDNVGLVPDWKIRALDYLGGTKKAGWRKISTQFVFAGDWLYTTPISGQHAYMATSWQNLVGGRVYRLTYPWRHRHDPAYAGMLQRLYSGGHAGTLSSDRMMLLHMAQAEPQDQQDPHYVHQVSSRAEAEQLNQQHLGDLDRRSFLHTITRVVTHQEGRPDTGLPCEDLQYVLRHHPRCKQAVDAAERLLAAPKVLELCVGTRVLLTNTIAVGLTAGRTGTVVGFQDKLGGGWPMVAFDDYGDEPIVIEKFSLDANDNNNYYTVTIAQVPLRHAWAISMHDAIGMTFKHTVVHFDAVAYMGDYGRAYAAIARGCSRDTVIISRRDKNVDITSVFRVDPAVVKFIQNNTAERTSAKMTGTRDGTGFVPVIDRIFDFSQQTEQHKLRRYLGGLPTMREMYAYRDKLARKRKLDSQTRVANKRNRIAEHQKNGSA